MKKKMFAILMCLVLAAAMAVPAFADGPNRYGCWDNMNYNLNVYGNDTISQNRNVCLWSAGGSNAQYWYYELGPDGQYRIKSALANKAYALNIYRYSSNLYNCDVMLWSNNLTDSAVTRTTSPTGGPWVIDLVNYSGYQLYRTGLGDNADVRWGYLPNGNHTWWPQ